MPYHVDSTGADRGRQCDTSILHKRFNSLLRLRAQRRNRVLIPIITLAITSVSVGVVLTITIPLHNPLHNDDHYTYITWGTLPLLAGFTVLLCVPVVSQRSLLNAYVVIDAAITSYYVERDAEYARTTLYARLGDTLTVRIEFALLLICIVINTTAVGYALIRMTVARVRNKRPTWLQVRLSISLAYSSLGATARSIGLLISGITTERNAMSSISFVEFIVFHVIFILECVCIALMFFSKNVHARLYRYMLGIDTNVTSAVGIAQLLDDRSLQEQLDKAANSFRAVRVCDITLDNLRRRVSVEGVSVEGVSVEGVSVEGDAMRAYVNSSMHCHKTIPLVRILIPWCASGIVSPSQTGGGICHAVETGSAPPSTIVHHATFGNVDAFVSHSWGDDPIAKYDALMAWRTWFLREKGREPTVWFDALCIDQVGDITNQLKLLPIFLSGCETLLLLYGQTYLTRLWCVTELFIFYHSRLPHLSDDDIQFIPIHLADITDDVFATARSFDVRKADATLPTDKVHLLSIIDGTGDSIDAFNEWTRTLIKTKLCAYRTAGLKHIEKDTTTRALNASRSE
jgi:hypothetical protein